MSLHTNKMLLYKQRVMSYYTSCVIVYPGHILRALRMPFFLSCLLGYHSSRNKIYESYVQYATYRVSVL